VVVPKTRRPKDDAVAGHRESLLYTASGGRMQERRERGVGARVGLDVAFRDALCLVRTERYHFQSVSAKGMDDLFSSFFHGADV
jgi:hypothetical protein